MTKRRALLLINTQARRGQDARDEAVEALQGLGFELVQDEPKSSEHISQVMSAHRDSVEIAIVGGGDGTLISSVDGLRTSGLPLGILPLGTINDLARALDIPVDLQAACEVLAHGTLKPIDVGSVNGKYFLNEASVGISTKIARQQTTEVKRKFGLAAIAGTTLKTLRYSRPFSAEIVYDGASQRTRTVQVTVANGYHFGAWVTDEEAALDDGNLKLYSIEVRRWFQIFPMLGALMAHRFKDCPGIRTLRAPKFTVKTRVPRDVFTDGEPATKTPATFESHRRAITVLVPESRT